jgi:alkanesulfonate monooxygenase SsuD/methylene tetrahydromethanopterin reductase-like flavin-dependent oxidoreductase (luciferase family)
VLYGALSQRTSKIRIGHAVVLLPFPYDHPVRVAERIATLDILSKGRVEVGTGRSATIQELGGAEFHLRKPALGRRVADSGRCLEEQGWDVFLEGALFRHTRANGRADADTKAPPTPVACLQQ